MNSKYSFSSCTTKWQNMLAVLSAEHVSLSSHFAWQYKKLCVMRFLTENILAFLMMFVGLSLDGRLSANTMPFWFSSGAATALVFMRGYSVLPGIFLGSLAAYYLQSNNLPFSIASALVYGLQVAILVWTSNQFICPTLVFYHKNKFIKFVLWASSLIALSTYVLVKLCAIFYLPTYAIFLMWLKWWLGNLGGIFIFSSAILTWDAYFSHVHHIKTINKLPLIFCYGLIFILAIILSFNLPLKIFCFFSVIMLINLIVISLKWRLSGIVAGICLAGLIIDLMHFLIIPFSTIHLIMPIMLLSYAISTWFALRVQNSC